MGRSDLVEVSGTLPSKPAAASSHPFLSRPKREALIRFARSCYVPLVNAGCQLKDSNTPPCAAVNFATETLGNFHVPPAFGAHQCFGGVLLMVIRRLSTLMYPPCVRLLKILLIISREAPTRSAIS